MTERESKVIELAIKWRDSKLAVEEALVRQELMHAIDMVKKERRDTKTEQAKGESISE